MSPGYKTNSKHKTTTATTTKNFIRKEELNRSHPGVGVGVEIHRNSRRGDAERFWETTQKSGELGGYF